MEVEFKVEGLPPKKDGATSMCVQPEYLQRLAALRKAARSALKGGEPLRTDIELQLDVHVPVAELASVGDLDSFVAGVCDGLMAAAGEHSKTLLDAPEWEDNQSGVGYGDRKSCTCGVSAESVLCGAMSRHKN